MTIHGRSRRSPRRACCVHFEALEGRQLLAASLNPIPNATVVQTLGLQVPLEAGPGAAANQTYSVTTDNANIQASVAHGKFLTINVNHTSSGANDPAFQGSLVFQLFDDLTPLTTSRIEGLVNQGFYTSKTFHRVASGFPDSTHFIVQGGSVNGDGTGDVTLPGFPFQDEFVLQLAFTGSGQLAMANAGRDTNSSQFFITTGQPRFLDFLHTIFGQLVSGQDVLTEMTQVPRNSQDGPLAPITMTSATLSDTNPNGVLHIDATQATAAVITHVTVTATDPATHMTASQTFQVSVVPNTQNERAILAVVPTDPVIGPGQTFSLQLNGSDAEASDVLKFTVQGGVTTNSQTGVQTFTPVQNATANVTATGLVTVTPNAGFVGDIPLIVGVRDQVDRSGTGTLDTPSNFDFHKITLHVTNEVSGVREIGRVLVVTPPPRTDKGTNSISIDQSGGAIQVTLNGTLSPLQPMATDIDRIVVYGATSGDTIFVAPAVDPAIAVTLDGGHGGTNFLQAGSGSTREHGWFGHNVLIGGPADDALIGASGHVKFIKSGGNDLLFAGNLPRHRHQRRSHFPPPSGTFFKFVGNRVVPIPTPGSTHATAGGHSSGAVTTASAGAKSAGLHAAAVQSNALNTKRHPAPPKKHNSFLGY